MAKKNYCFESSRGNLFACFGLFVFLVCLGSFTAVPRSEFVVCCYGVVYLPYVSWRNCAHHLAHDVVFFFTGILS